MRPGDTVGDRFKLLHVAGAGGMGEVYQALDEKTGERVAVKVLTGGRGADVARFAREARILAELEHPRIVRYIAHGALASGEPYLAMEWLSGEDLSVRLRRGRMDPAEGARLGEHVAEALSFAHARGVVHRDLKPSNIYLVGGAVESVKLLDFGIAHLDAASTMTRTGMLVGTPAYMAPEQARGDMRIDARADVFSLGCVLFECLVGEPAFTGMHVMAVLARILFDELPSAREKEPSVPEPLSRLIGRMTSKSPDERPRDGAMVADLLRELREPVQTSSWRLEGDSMLPEALTRSEQRAVAAILLSAQSGGKEAMLEAATTLDQGIDTALRREVHTYGAALEDLLDGSMAVVLTSASFATDLAAQAARVALALRAHHSGRSIALAIGRGERTERLPTGHAIDRAARLIEGLMKGGSEVSALGAAPGWKPIVLDEVTVGLLDARFDVRESEVGFTLEGERELAVGTRTLLGKATPCVGRDWELRSLEQHFEECVEERSARVVLVTAPAGGGKSRLVQEFLRSVSARGEPTALWIGRGDPLRAGSAFGLLGQAIRGACGIRDGEPLAVRRERLVARVHEGVAAGEQRRVAEFLGEIIGVPFPDEEESMPFRVARRDAQLMFDQMRESFLLFVAAACEAGPLLVLLEDLHWGDRPTVQFLDRALRDLRDQPLFVLAVARPEVHEVFPKLWSERRLQEIKLKELSRKAMERLARHVLGEGVDGEMVDRLARLSEGNAFYLEELIRRAAEARGEDLPETLVAMVQSRLHALDDDARRVLRAASVFGELFWVGGVASMLGGASKERWVTDRLQELLEKEVIVQRGEGRFPGERDYAFRHALLREAAYTMLTDQDRALGHRFAGEWLERRGERDTLVLAEHFERGGAGVRAGQCFLRAAQQALLGGDAAGALKHGQRGLACPVEDPLRIKLLGAICEAVVWSLAAPLPDAEELVRVAERGSVPWLQGMGARLHGLAQAGRLDEFTAALDVLRETEVRPDTVAPMAHCLLFGTYFLDNAGRVDEADVLLGRLAMIARTTGEREPLVLILWHGICALRGASAKEDPWEAIEHGKAALARARVVGHSRFVGIAQAYLGMNLWLIGAAREAERVLGEITLPDEELGFGLSRRHFSLAWLFAERGAFDEAKVWANRLVEAGVVRRVGLFEGLGRWVLGEVLRRAGDLEAAEIEISAALGVMGDVVPLERPGVLSSLAALRLAQARPGEALLVVREAIARADAIGACSRFFRTAFMHLTHGECLEATGDHEGACAAIARAREWILRVAEKIVDAAYRRSYLEEVPENRRILALGERWIGAAEMVK